jgi:hypothetical protein
VTEPLVEMSMHFIGGLREIWKLVLMVRGGEGIGADVWAIRKFLQGGV